MRQNRVRRNAGDKRRKRPHLVVPAGAAIANFVPKKKVANRLKTLESLCLLGTMPTRSGQALRTSRSSDFSKAPITIARREQDSSDRAVARKTGAASARHTEAHSHPPAPTQLQPLLGYRSAGENVSTSALVLDVGIWLPLDDLIYFESTGTQTARHLVGIEEEEINTDSLPPPLIQVNGLVADVEAQQQNTVGAQNSVKLP